LRFFAAKIFSIWVNLFTLIANDRLYSDNYIFHNSPSADPRKESRTQPGTVPARYRFCFAMLSHLQGPEPLLSLRLAESAFLEPVKLTLATLVFDRFGSSPDSYR
jgi:hypothetical protein